MTVSPTTKKKKKKDKKDKTKQNQLMKATEASSEESDPYHGIIQKQLEKRLSKEFNTIFLKVTNMTYYYRNRQILGQKRFHMRETKQNPVSNQYDANIFTLEFDNETGGIKKKKTWLGQTSKKGHALRLCQKGK